MESLLLELKNLISNYTTKPNFIFLKVLCLITWAVYLLKLSTVPLQLVIITFCLIFICTFFMSYIKIAKAYNTQLKEKEEKQNIEKSIKNTIVPENKQIKTDKISTNI